MADKIKLFNEDNLEVMKKLQDESIDIICIDPPYLYLKNQKLDRPFDELKFFSECRRILTKDGFLITFGRGISFYRWNLILHDLGFVFKEEIIWNKRQTNSPVMPIFRTHETISIFAKDKGIINTVTFPYIEKKQFDIPALINDVKRIKSSLNNEKSFNEIINFLKTGEKKYTATTPGRGLTRSIKSNLNVDRGVITVNSIKNGNKPSSIIEMIRDHYTSIHPTQKPVKLLIRLLMLCLPKKKKITIADFFGGSFSTMEAVLELTKMYPEIEFEGISCELDEEYYDGGFKRIEKLINNVKG